ncbi:uncharacterized protein LOC127177875 [Labeo rohita]|uniref:uncharacterized protein LOC127177875 n=1 Tax=Labeo rohita TaxID=84645 RepID=UPI0021E1E8A5|nr:uncharacterized protein LOC127177875 [Labeo rohita]
MSSHVSPSFESVELNSSSSVSADAQLMLKKQTKKSKKKGVRAFFQRIGKAIKRCTLCCYGDYTLPPFPCDDPADVQPGLSGLEWALSIDPCPSGIELTVNADPADLDPPSVSEPSSLEVTPDSNPADPELSHVPGPFSLDLKLTLDTGLYKLDVDPAEPNPPTVLGPSTPDSEITPVPGPSAFGATVEQQSKKKKKKGVCGFFRRTWRAVRRSALRYQRGNKVAPDPFAINPVATRDPADLQPVLFSISWPKLNAEPTYLEPSSVPGPSILNNEPMLAPRQSGCEPADEKETKMWKKKDIQAFFQRTWRTVKFSFLAPDSCHVEPMALSAPFWVLTADPGPSCFEVTVTANQDPGPSGLVVELMSVSGPSSHEIKPAPSPPSLMLTPDMSLDVPETKPLLGSSLELMPLQADT